MRRRWVNVAFPVAGAAIVFGAVLFLWTNVFLQLIAVLAGLLLVEGGTWRLARPILADERRYRALRAEVDAFIGMVRRLNRAAVARSADQVAAAEFEAVRRDMSVSLDRMAEVAGVEDAVRRGRPDGAAERM